MSDEPQRPASTDNREGWKAYWAAKGMPWRTEPEIDGERQRFLTERRAVKPDIEKGIYPFRDENGGIRLTRADVEWLLATHESGGMRGPTDWSDKKQRMREGMDLRGADLRRADLSGLPLARLCGGLSGPDFDKADFIQLDAAAVLLRRANLRGTLLQASLTLPRFRGVSAASGSLLHEQTGGKS